MSCGIYCYLDKKTNNIIYIGKDSYINKQIRNKEHFMRGKRKDQHINKVLQNNPNRYQYKVLEEGNISQKILNALEMSFIQRYNPRFNFTKGGDGSLGYKHTINTKKAVSLSVSKKSSSTGFYRVSKKKCKTCQFKTSFVYQYKINGKRKEIWGVDINSLKKKVLDKNLDWIILDEEKANNILKENSLLSKKRGRKNSSGYLNVLKREASYAYRYTENGKRKYLSDKTLKGLEEKVKKRGLEWKKL